MKGIVFNVLEEVVSAVHGEDAWDDMLAEAGVDGAYTAVGSYPDAEFRALAAAAATRLGGEEAEVIRATGRAALPIFARRYPDLVQVHGSARSLALALNDIIHPEVRKLYPGADVPWFDCDASRPDVLILGYRSQRRLCEFAEGLLLGAGDWFGEQITVDQPRCMHRGDDHCELRIAGA
jgi:heme-NO-binding protein